MRRMKILSRVVLIGGGVVLAAAVALLISNIWNIQMIYQVAMSNKSQASINDPLPMVLLAAGLSAVGGFLVGLALTMPKGKKDAPVAAKAKS